MSSLVCEIDFPASKSTNVFYLSGRWRFASQAFFCDVPCLLAFLRITSWRRWQWQTSMRLWSQQLYKQSSMLAKGPLVRLVAEAEEVTAQVCTASTHQANNKLFIGCVVSICEWHKVAWSGKIAFYPDCTSFDFGDAHGLQLVSWWKHCSANETQKRGWGLSYPVLFMSVSILLIVMTLSSFCDASSTPFAGISSWTPCQFSQWQQRRSEDLVKSGVWACPISLQWLLPWGNKVIHQQL